jgi:hypothetical protein
LDQFKVGLGDGPFSDGDEQHCHSISDRNRRRQKKMHETEKKLQVEFGWKFDEIMG